MPDLVAGRLILDGGILDASKSSVKPRTPAICKAKPNPLQPTNARFFPHPVPSTEHEKMLFYRPLKTLETQETEIPITASIG